jgi:hypothetical protein
MSGQQVVLWYEQAMRERGEEKLLDLHVQLVPHTKDPSSSYRDIERALTKMTEPKKPHGR